jgi:hypothetical protein
VIEKRGKLLDFVKVSLQEHFLSEQYSAADIVEWVQWFCGTHGSPVFYAVPVPQDGEWDVNSPNYQVLSYLIFVSVRSRLFMKKPHGFLKNKLLVNVAANFLPEIKKTAFDFGPPRGLFVLMLTAVRLACYCAFSNFIWLSQYEKVVRSYKTGVYVPSGDFSAKLCNTWVKQYNRNFNKVSQERWEEILTYYDITPTSDIEGVGDQSILDEGRGALPMSSSPSITSADI